MAGAVETVSEDLKNNKVYALQVAQAHLRINNGLEDLVNNWSNWSQGINSGFGTSQYT